jgi:putative methyltransferase
VKKSVHIFQPQYDAVLGDKNIQPWLPYSAACLWAYAQSFDDVRDSWQLGNLHYQRLPIAQVVAGLVEPSLCAFSCYVWNEKYNLALAEAIKQRWPSCAIVFGGPQTGGNHLGYSFIDCIVMSEGEVCFRDILRQIRDGQPLENLMSRPRLENLDIPSPYLLGLFDGIVDTAPANTLFQTVLETNRGCPFQCTFCDWGTLTYSKVRKFGLERIEAELHWIASKPISVIFLADANFGIFKQRDMEIAHMMNRILTGSKVDYMNITFTKNSNATVFEIARSIGSMAKSVTLSMQSMNPATLRAIKRDNMKSNDLEDMLRLARKYDVPTYTDMILGLPLETLETWKVGLMQLLEMGQDSYIDTNFANILENTDLNLTQRQQYGIRSIKVENYQGFSERDITGIQEGTELVCETNTMSTDDMVASWMWHWLVQFFHTSGYSHIAAKYAHHVHGVSYLTFYENLFDLVANDPGVIGDEFRRNQRMALSLLTTGSFGSGINNVYDFYIASFQPFWNNIHHVMSLVEQALMSVAPQNHSVMQIQRHALHNPHWPPGACVICDYDIDSWKEQQTCYRILSVLPEFDGSYEAFRRNRRGVYWKNRLVQIEVAESRDICYNVA